MEREIWSIRSGDAYPVDRRVWTRSTGSEDGAFTLRADVLARPVYN